MTSLRLLLIFGCVLLGAGCTANPRTRAEGQLRNGGAERLRRDAALIYKDTFAAPGKPAFNEINFKQWPKSFQKLRPLHVGIYLDGISIALHAGERGESGLYIVPQSMDHEPRDARGAKFERLADGVFWYSFHTKVGEPNAAPP